MIFDVTLVIVLGHHEPCPNNMANLMDKFCVFWLLYQPAVVLSLPPFNPPYSLRHSIETRPINNSAMASKCQVKGRVNRYGRLYCCVIWRNCHSYPSLQQPPPWSVSSHQHQGKTFHQQKDYSSLKSQMMVSIFLAITYFFLNFLNVLFIFEAERDRAWAGDGQRERETENPRQAPGSELSA